MALINVLCTAALQKVTYTLVCVWTEGSVGDVPWSPSGITIKGIKAQEMGKEIKEDRKSARCKQFGMEVCSVIFQDAEQSKGSLEPMLGSKASQSTTNISITQ